MTTVYSGYSSESTQGSRKYRCKLVYSVSYPDNSTAKISMQTIFNVTGQITNDTLGGDLDIEDLDYDGSPDHELAEYWIVENKKISADTNKTLISKTVTVNRLTTSLRIRIEGGVWATASGWSGVTKSVSATLTIKPVAYDIVLVNSVGSEFIATVTKYYGTSLDISNYVPVVAGYDFLGWSTTIGKSSTSAGDITNNIVTVNADTRYYTVRHQSYVPPTISNIRAYRVADGASEQDPVAKSNGEKCYMDFDFVMPQQITGNVTYKATFGNTTLSSVTLTQSGRVYAYTSTNHLPTSDGETVSIAVSVTDYQGNTYTYTDATYISSEIYLIDMYKGQETIDGNTVLYQSMAIGKEEARDGVNTADSTSVLYSETLSENGNLDVYMDTEFENDVKINGGLYFNDSDTPIGTVIQKVGGTDYTTDLSTGSTGTEKNIASIVIPKGVWIVQIRCRYTPSASGAHYSKIVFSTTSASTALHDRNYLTSDLAIAHNVTNVVVQTNDEPQTYYLSGSVGGQTGNWNRTSSAALLIRAVRIL